ncbi:MAG: hypothetical protein SFX18_03625 [Pirellulales bacterium]|nr:hypothetical protein [Pirellulales bacterium]
MSAHIPDRHDIPGEPSIPPVTRGVSGAGRSRRTPAEFAALAWQTYSIRNSRRRRMQRAMPVVLIMLLCGGWSVWQFSRLAGPNVPLVRHHPAVPQPILTDTARRVPPLANNRAVGEPTIPLPSPAVAPTLPRPPRSPASVPTPAQVTAFHQELAALAAELDELKHDVQDLNAQVATCVELTAQRELLAAGTPADSLGMLVGAGELESLTDPSTGPNTVATSAASRSGSASAKQHQVDFAVWQARHQHEQTAATLLAWARNLAERRQTDRALAEYVRIIERFPDSLAAVTAKVESHQLRAM